MSVLNGVVLWLCTVETQQETGPPGVWGVQIGETAKGSRRRQGAYTFGSTVHHAGTLGNHGCGCESTGTHDVMGAARRVSV